MSMFRCNNCGGTYTGAMPDGTIYFHRCPELPGSLKKTRKDYNIRDENLVVPGFGAVPHIKSEGLGVTCIEDPDLTQPIWITQLDALQAQEDEG